MNSHSQAPMPDVLRHQMRAKHHPARSYPCPWCGVRSHQPCVIPVGGKRPKTLHQQRLAVWARNTACCPECQVEPGIPCHRNGRALENGAVHARRYQEAEEVA